MNQNPYLILLFSALVLCSGCTYIAYALEMAGADPDVPYPYSGPPTIPDDPPEAYPQSIQVEIDKESFRHRYEYSGVYMNDTHKEIYIVNCENEQDSHLEKWNGEYWEKVFFVDNDSRHDHYFTYSRIEFMEKIELQIPLGIKNSKFRGPYRFAMMLSLNPDESEWFVVYSRSFTIYREYRRINVVLAEN